MPSSVQLYVTFGCMMMSNRIDFFNPTFVRLVRCVGAVYHFIVHKFLIQLYLQVCFCRSNSYPGETLCFVSSRLTSDLNLTVMVLKQLFVLYVHLVAKRTGDTSKVDESNPAVDMLLSQLQLDENA